VLYLFTDLFKDCGTTFEVQYCRTVNCDTCFEVIRH